LSVSLASGQPPFVNAKTPSPSSAAQQLGTIAGSDLPVRPVDPTAPAADIMGADPSMQISEPDSGAVTEVSRLLAKFASVEVNIKVTGNDPKPPVTPAEVASQRLSMLDGQANPGPLRPAEGQPLTQLFPTSEHSSARAGEVSAGGPSSLTPIPENAPDQATASKPEIPSGPEPGSSNSVPVAHSSQGSPAAALETGSGKQVEANANTSSSASAPMPVASAVETHSNSQEGAASNESRTGQGSVSAGTEDPSTTKPAPPVIASNATTDMSGNLLATHAPASSATHPSASPGTAEAPPTQAPQTLAAWQNYESSTGKIVTSARLSDAMNGGEMHVELRSGALGPMEVRAVLRDGSVGAEIHVEGREAHTLLASNLPSLERALGDRELSVGNLAVYQDHVGGGMNGGDRQNSQSSSSPVPRDQVRHGDTPIRPASQGEVGYEVEEGVNLTGGLSVHA